MISTRFRYIRPGNLLKHFRIVRETEAIGPMGRPVASFSDSGSMELEGVLADATASDLEKWKQLQHPISHTIVQAGPPKAKAEDKLILDERIFQIHAVDDCDGLGITTIYYAEERTDVR